MSAPEIFALGAILLAVGLAAGFAGGLFGIGGGIVTTPILYLLLRTHGVADDMALKTALGTSLAVIIVTSLGALLTHSKHGEVDGSLLRAWAPWIASGAVLGGMLAKYAPGEVLALIFAGGAGFIAFRRLTGGRSGSPRPGVDLTAKVIHIPIGFATGTFASLMGIGGGAAGVMVMTMSGKSMHQAVATASGFGIAVAVPGALSFIVAGWSAAGAPFGNLGFVSAPAFLAMALGAGLAAPWGAKIAHRVNGAILSRLFGAYIALAAIGMLIDVFARA